jgi:hypothetical protein
MKLQTRLLITAALWLLLGTALGYWRMVYAGGMGKHVGFLYRVCAATRPPLGHSVGAGELVRSLARLMRTRVRRTGTGTIRNRRPRGAQETY